jgi:Protein of unknown function (DUF2726)
MTMEVRPRVWHRVLGWLKSAGETPRAPAAVAADVWPVHSKVLLTQSEQRLYKLLTEVLPHHCIFAQVAVSQLIGLDTGAPWSIRNRYSQLVVDFVICGTDYRPLLVVELDGISHEHPKQAEADARKVAVLRAAKLDLIHINAAALPSSSELKSMLRGLNPAGASSRARYWARYHAERHRSKAKSPP